MFFNKAKKRGQQLAALALDLPNSGEAREFISRIALKPEEVLRFHWGVGIVNMVTAAWFVNVSVNNPDTAKSILEPMLQGYEDAVEATGAAPVRIGDLIVDEEEKRFVRDTIMSSIETGKIDNVDNVTTTIRSLTGMIYNRRQAQYYDDLRIGMKEALSSVQHTLGPMFHVARRFAAHLTGKKDDSSLVVPLSLLLGAFSTVLMDYCRREIEK